MMDNTDNQPGAGILQGSENDSPNLIHNPYPTPQKHVAKQMDFDIQPPASQMHFDLVDMSGIDYFDLN